MTAILVGSAETAAPRCPSSGRLDGSAPPASRGQPGLGPRALGALAYALGPLSGATLLLLRRQDRFVRFHAAQSVMAGLLQAAVGYALFFVLLLFAMLPPTGWVVAVALATMFVLGSLAQWIVLMRRAARGEVWRDPVVGDRAWQYATRTDRRALTGHGPTGP